MQERLEPSIEIKFSLKNKEVSMPVGGKMQRRAGDIICLFADGYDASLRILRSTIYGYST